MDSSNTREAQNQPKAAVEIAAERPPPWERPRTLLLMAIWFGLLTGAVEALGLFVLHCWNRAILDFISPFLWTIPLSNAALFTFPGLAFFLRARRRGLSPRLRKIALFCLCTIAVSSMVHSVSSMLI